MELVLGEYAVGTDFKLGEYAVGTEAYRCCCTVSTQLVLRRTGVVVQ